MLFNNFYKKKKVNCLIDYQKLVKTKNVVIFKTNVTIKKKLSRFCL